MLSRRNGLISRSLLSALAALVTAAVPTLVSSSALASEANKDRDDSAQTQEKAAKPTKHHKVSHTPKAHKRASKDDKKQEHARSSSHEEKAVDAPLLKVDSDKSEKSESKKTSNKGNNKKASKKGPSKKNGSKKTTAKKGDSDAPRRRGSNAHPAKPCTATPIAIDRGGIERESMPLVDCKGGMLESSREKLSVLARPWAAAKPTELPPEKEIQVDAKKGAEIASGVKLLDRGLVVRLESITKRFPGKSLSVVSGYRPQSNGSQHQAARALDLRVNGVSNEELVAFCKTLQDTGCGYYPNSSFVHVDVRTPGTGSVTWIDASGPGESPRYVTQWPPPGSKDPSVVAKAAAIDDDDATEAKGDIEEHAGKAL